ncbi:Hpt domain-containing response regulator, partial [Calditerrivibrio nitroreducens]
RMIPDYVDIPIIAVSAHAFKADADKSIEAGMNDHLTKPVSMNELFKTISKWVKLKYTFSNEPKTDSVSEIPFLDFQDLKMRGSDPENIKFLVNLFVEEINRDIPIIKQCIQENEIEKLQKIIHKHKGASGNVSLVDIHKNLVEIDKLLKAKTEPKMIKNLFDKFFDQIDILNSYKETLEGSRKEIVSFKKISKDDIEELTKLLLDNNLKAIEKYEDMKYGLSSVDGLLTNQLGLAISNLNFTEAFMILDELKKKGLL